jgi:hypothetical protein
VLRSLAVKKWAIPQILTIIEDRNVATAEAPFHSIWKSE